MNIYSKIIPNKWLMLGFCLTSLIVYWYLYVRNRRESVPRVSQPMCSHTMSNCTSQNFERTISFPYTPSHFANVFTKPKTPSTNITVISKEEWDFLLEELKWPVPSTEITSLSDTTDPYMCSFFVINLKETYTVGDFVNVMIVARKNNGAPKTYGGDFFQAKLYNTELKASTFGSVVDHYNGTYTVSFALLWPGAARVSVRLIHSSEAVQILSRYREEDPDKVFFHGYFEDGGQKETVMCNAMKSPGLNVSSSICCCEYPDPYTGEIWFCRRPTSLPCSALVYHSMGGYQANLSKNESAVLNRNHTNVVLPGQSPVIKVLSQEANLRETKRCIRGLDTPVPSGFFFKDQWTSQVCAMKEFPREEMRRCLTGKEVHMMGDSTLRQWFEFIGKTLPELAPIKRHSSEKSGPLLMVNSQTNTYITWRAHGLPLRTTKTPMADLHYVANELKDLAGGEHTVVAFNLWAHFTTHPVHLFVRRIAIIRRAVKSLLQRAPHTLVVIKSANTGYKDVYGSDWLSWQLDSVLRAMFRGLPVVLMDVWQMTSCHYSPDDIHPPAIVIQNEVNLFLSFVCPH